MRTRAHTHTHTHMQMHTHWHNIPVGGGGGGVKTKTSVSTGIKALVAKEKTYTTEMEKKTKITDLSPVIGISAVSHICHVIILQQKKAKEYNVKAHFVDVPSPRDFVESQ